MANDFRCAGKEMNINELAKEVGIPEARMEISDKRLERFASSVRSETISEVVCKIVVLFDERGYDPTLEEELLTIIRAMK